MRGRKVSARILGIILIMSIIITSYGGGYVLAAPDNTVTFQWEKHDTVDNILNLAANSAGSNEALVKWNFIGTGVGGKYEVSYHLPDIEGNVNNIRARFENDGENLNIYVRVLDSSGDNITGQLATDLVETDFEEKSPIEKKVDANTRFDHDGNGTLEGTELDKKELKYVVPNSAKYRGISIKLAGIAIRAKWISDEIYFYTNGLLPGHIIPFELTTPVNPSSAPLQLNILTSLDGFVTKPTHWVDASNDKGTIALPNADGEIPGGRPGIQIKFKQPKALNNTKDAFTNADLSGVRASMLVKEGSSDTSGTGTGVVSKQIWIPLMDGITGDTSGPIQNSSGASTMKNFSYKDNTYTIEMVKDDTGLGPDFFKWEQLEANRVYNVEIDLDGLVVNKGITSKTHKQYAYSYIKYEVKRASYENTYLLITPYKGNDASENRYTIFSGSVKETITELLTHYQPPGQVNKDIYIPVPYYSGADNQYYRVDVQFAGRPIVSQVIEYNPSIDEDVPPPTPKITEIDNIVVLPPDATENTIEPNKVQFDLKFAAPSKAILEKMFAEGKEIYYELLANRIPSNTEDSAYSIIKVYKASLTDGKVVLTAVENLGSTEKVKETGKYVQGYNQNDNLFAVDNVILKDNIDTSVIGKGWINSLDRIIDSDGKVTYNQTTNKPIDYPGLNYFKMRAIAVKDGKYVAESDNSVTVSISLDLTTVSVPIPTVINYQPVLPGDKDQLLGIDLFWDAIDISQYEDYMLRPIEKNILNDRIRYEVLLSRSKKAITDFTKTNQVIEPTADKEIELDIVDNELVLSPDDISTLRTDGIIKITKWVDKTATGSIKQPILGLDTNQNYYIRIRAVVQDQVDESIIEASGYSNLVTITTPANPWDNENDINLPLAPANLDIRFKLDSKIESWVTWEYKEEFDFEDPLCFEMIRLTDKSMAKEYANLTIEEIAEALVKDNPLEKFESYRVRNTDSGYVLSSLKYNPTQKAWQWVDEVDRTPEVDDRQVRIDSKDLSPNTIYYYYVRTVRPSPIVENYKASAWIMETLTTEPIKAPINLIVPRPTPVEFTPYDKKREVIIRFDAPIPYDNFVVNSSNQLISLRDYQIEVHVKSEDDTDYSYTSFPIEFLKKEKATNDTYTRVYYKISGLKPGKSYSIKTKIVDLTRAELSPDGTTVIYPKSNFSELVTTRTDFDQTDYDKEQKYLQYIAYYESVAEQLKDTNYWVLEDGLDNYIIKYRETATKGEVILYKNSEYQLVSKEKGKLVYYIPSGVLDYSNLNNTTLAIKDSLNQVGIRPNSIGQEHTKEIQSVIEKIKQYNSTIKDYVVKVEITTGAFNGKINGQNPFSNLVDIQLKVVPINTTEDNIDISILNELDSVIKEKRTVLIDKLEVELVKGINDERLNAIVKETINQVKIEHQRRMNSRFKSYLGVESTIPTTNEPISIAWNLETPSYLVAAYYKTGNQWVNLDYKQLGNRYVLNATKTGSYILTNSSGSLGVNLDSNTLSLITRYGLNDIYTSMELNDVTTKPSKHQTITSIARILGASKSDDSVQYLKNQGFTFVNGISLHSEMKKSDAYYLIFRAYEKKKNTSLSKVYIQNHSAIKDLNLINEDYQRLFLAAEQLKLIKTQDGYLRPNSSITIKELFDSLRNLE